MVPKPDEWKFCIDVTYFWVLPTSPIYIVKRIFELITRYHYLQGDPEPIVSDQNDKGIENVELSKLT